MDLRIRRLDSADGSDLEASYRVRAAAEAHDLPDFPPWSWTDHVGRLVHPWPAQREFMWLAEAGGEPVGVLEIALPERENLHLVNTELVVRPDQRRRGFGRALHAWAIQFTRENGRRMLTGECMSGPSEQPARSSGNAAFARAMGAQPALDRVRRRLDVASTDEAAWDSLLAKAASTANAYSLVEWIGAAPEEYVADIAALDSRLLLDSPTGDLDIEPERVDVARVRAFEETAHKRGRRLYHVGARHDTSGQLVAWTTLAFDADVRTHAWQLITIVDPSHRGHRLGLLVKIANLQHTRTHEPALATVDTWNAAENAHMIAINEELGFRARDTWTDWQQEV
jgi:GNAT superfamily N-acetyltransferase